MIKNPKNYIEIFLVENLLTFSWLAKNTEIKRTTLIHKVRNRCNLELVHTLSYYEYRKIENLINEMEN